MAQKPFLELLKTDNSNAQNTNALRGFPEGIKTASPGFEAVSQSSPVAPPFQGQADFNMNQELINLIYPGKTQTDPRFSSVLQSMYQHLLKSMKPDQALQVLLKMGGGTPETVNRLFGQAGSEAAKAYIKSKNLFLASEQDELQKQTLAALQSVYQNPNQTQG